MAEEKPNLITEEPIERDPRETTGINAIVIMEVIGKPPEHLKATLEEIVQKMGEEKGVTIKESKINEPVLMKDQEEFYTTFAEIEVEVEDIMVLNLLMFKYMPAHMEVVSPEIVTLTNNGWNEVFNELVRKLHGYDEVVRVLQAQNALMQRKMKELGITEEDLRGKKKDEPLEKVSEEDKISETDEEKKEE
tara:strand:- start:1379 stop:1951 length:573 start_codon:yes stop_codon:yes gene_type:complete